MRRIDRGILHAKRAALLSTLRCRVGAAIMSGPRLLSIGWNSNKTAPYLNSVMRWHHAETAALVGVRRADLRNADIFVVRLSKDDEFRMAKPCRMCQELLRSAGIYRAYFTDYSGGISVMKL